MNKTVSKLLASAAGLSFSLFPGTEAEAQTGCQYLSYGAVLTVAQWNYCFTIKQDNLGFTPLNSAGGTMVGPLVTSLPTSLLAGFNLPPGTAPGAPNNGDMWTTSAGLFIQINGTTVGPLIGGTGFVVTGKITTLASGTAGAGFNIPQGAAPLSPVNGDVWTTSVGIFVQINGATVGPLFSGTGGTLTGKLTTIASATGGAGINLPAGVAPTSPVNGDLWSTSSGLFVQINGGTVGPLFSGTGGTLTGKLTTIASAAGNAGFNLPPGAAPTSPTNGDLWMTSTGLFGQINGTTFGPFVTNFNTRTGSVTPAAGDYTLNQIYNCTMNPQGRLTFQTATPIMTATVTGATAHFYTQYLGQQVPIYDGTRFNCVDTGGELTQNATDTTKSPAAVANNSCYDVLVWSDSGTIRATRGQAWTSVTSRGSGATLARIKGILVNSNGVANGPAANLGTYIGTECSNGTATFDWILGASASGGTAASLNAWNQYNRVDIATQVTDSGVAYTYGTATIRQARASAGNQVTFVSGNPEDGVQVAYNTFNLSSGTAGDGVLIGFGLDSTSTFTQQAIEFLSPTANAVSISLMGVWTIAPQTGRHVLSANEETNAAVNSTFDNGSANVFSVKFRM